MPVATLLLRENTTTPLSSIVERAQHKKPPLPEYDLRLTSRQLDLVLTSPAETFVKPAPTDEGFESDIDSISIVSSDESFTSGNSPEITKTPETDSANGSASSDSDTEAPTSQTIPTTKTDVPRITTRCFNETYDLVDCMCYTDVKSPKILVFVIKNEALVFCFGHLDSLQDFYTKFSTVKAVTNQKAYGKSCSNSNSNNNKFNLLQRTDNNGITHIEIRRENKSPLFYQESGETSIISINTPETNSTAQGNGPDKSQSFSVEDQFHLRKNEALDKSTPRYNSLTLGKESRSNVKDSNSRQRSESSFINDTRSNTLHSKTDWSKNSGRQKFASSENILGCDDRSPVALKNIEPSYKKIWNSAEDLLDSPKKSERRRKLKGKAPQPPNENQDVLKGQYVRVNVTPTPFGQQYSNNMRDTLNKLQTKNQIPQPFGSAKPKLTTYQQFKYVEPKTAKPLLSSSESSWTNSVPRFFKKARAQSETRPTTPMAYRYVDTTQNGAHNYYNTMDASPGHSVSNRLFGMSSKLVDFSTTSAGRYPGWGSSGDVRRGSLGEISYKINQNGGSLKSVIKKDDAKSKKSNDKKVTFSAYTTVQVV